jgi:uncharacterized Zn ribbon protein
MKKELIRFFCPSCNNRWDAECPIKMDNDEEFVYIEHPQETCPKCGDQGEQAENNDLN